jgi:hypothetical protein
MIRFVDLTQAYRTHPEDPKNPPKPVCAFLDTVMDMFIAWDDGTHIFTGLDDLAYVNDYVRERCRALVPNGFFEPKR